MLAIGLNASLPADEIDFEIIMYDTSSHVDVQFDNLLANIHTNYIDLCDNQISSTHCAFSNLTYNQWLTGAVLATPLPD